MEDLRKTTDKRKNFSCRRCNLPDHADNNMVACDNCSKWEHFMCAGVDSSVKKRPYSCKECHELTARVNSQQDSIQQKSTAASSNKQLDSLKVQHSGKTTKSSVAGSKTGSKVGSKVSSVTRASEKRAGSITSITSQARLDAEMKLAEEEQCLKEQQLKEEEALRMRELDEMQRQLEEKKILMEEEKQIRALKLEREKLSQVKQQAIRQESLEKKRDLMRQLSINGSTAGSVINSKEKVNDWLDKIVGKPVKDVRQYPKSNATLPPRDSARNNSQDPVPNSEEINASPRPPSCSHRNTKQLPNIGFHDLPSSDGAEHDNSSPSSPLDRCFNALDPNPRCSSVTGSERSRSTVLGTQHIAAWQVIGKELPSFSGNPEDWPIFISCFDQSTAVCGFSDAENLIRLQRCLKGHALEAVRSRLLLPSGVPYVINTLRILFGRPELLIRALLDKVHRLPSPKYERLETVMEYGLAVQNLVDHLSAAQQEDHLTNPMLMHELVDNLPGPLKLS